ncbi:MAG: hypothetical protein HY927_06670 [Elusimicrobia bacterium]|nr:hypothetical protein [Elusimicrobiota bacterium]
MPDIRRGLLKLRRPVAVLVIAALLVAEQGLAAVQAVAQTVASPKTGQAAPGGVPSVQGIPGLNAPVSPAAWAAPGLGLDGSILPSLPSAPGVELRPQATREAPGALRAAVPGLEAIPALAAPAAAMGAPSSQAQDALSPEGTAAKAAPQDVPLPVEANPAVSAAPDLRGAGLSRATPAAEQQGRTDARLDAGQARLTGLQRLTRGISKIGAAVSLRRFFDNDASAKGEPAAPSFEPERVKVYLTRHGSDPVETDLKALGGVLSSDPRYLASLNKSGRVRLVVSAGDAQGGLTKADLEGVRGAVRSMGVTAKIDVEKLAVNWAGPIRPNAQDGSSPQAAEAASKAKANPVWRYLIGPITAPFRELYYLGRTLKSSFSRPSWIEVIGGLASKAPPFIMGLAWWAKTFLPAHPATWLIAVGYSLVLNVFHGVFIDTWNTFQNRIGKQRGLQYQTVFNFLYGQIPGALFRVLVWSAIPTTVPPWAAAYWRDIGIATVIGTFCGTLGYQGLNGLYDKGIISRGMRSGFQQVRDLFFCLSGIFFGTGSMTFFWAFFIIQQSMDILLYVVSRRLAKRSIAYVADAKLAATDDFQGMYPVKPGPEVSPLKSALMAIIDNPIVKLPIAFVKYLIRLLKKKTGA